MRVTARRRARDISRDGEYGDGVTRSLVLVLALAATTHARGLRWNAPDDCPDEATVRSAIERRLEASLDSVTFEVGVDIDPGPEGFVAHVSIADTEPRTLASASCAELTDAVAVVIARLATEVRAAPVHVPRRVPAWNVGARGDAIAGSGTTPELGVAGEVAAWFAWHRMRVEVLGEHWRASTARLDSTAAGVEVQLDALGIRAGVERGVLRAWAVGELGVLHGTGLGLMAPKSGDATWLAVGAGAGAGWPIAPHVRLVLACELEIPFDRVGFALGSGALVYRTGLVAVRGGLGIELGWR
jgi:hypothetical protein